MRKIAILFLAALLGAVQVNGQYLTVKGSVPLTPRAAVTSSGTLAYAVGANSFSIVSFASPSSPSVSGQVAPGAATLSGVVVRGDYAYCAGQNSGIVVIDVTPPSSPTWVRNVLAAAPIKHVSVSDTFLAVATSLNVTLYGLSSPDQPHFLTAYGRPANQVVIDAAARKIHCAGNDGAFLLGWTVSQGNVTLTEADEFGTADYSLVARGGSYVSFVQGLQMSALNPSTYSLAGQYATTGQIGGLASASDFSVIGTTTGGIEFLRQTSGTPQFASSVQVTGGVNGLAVSGNEQYILAATSAGLSVIENSPLDADDAPLLPREFALGAYPNPFNPSTMVTWGAPLRGAAELVVFDVLGHEVLRRSVPQAEQTFALDFTGLSAGNYFLRMDVPGTEVTPLRLTYLP